MDDPTPAPIDAFLTTCLSRTMVWDGTCPKCLGTVICVMVPSGLLTDPFCVDCDYHPRGKRLSLALDDP
jgi:hypothetical protein